MARSKIDQTNIREGIPLAPITPAQEAALAENTLYLDQDNIFKIKKDPAGIPIVDAAGGLVGAGMFFYRDSNTSPTNSTKVQKVRFTGDAITAFSYSSGTGEVTIQLTAGTGGGGGGSPSGAAGGDLDGLYPDPIIRELIPNPAGTYALANVTVNAKGQVTAATAGATISSPSTGQVLRYGNSGLVNASEPYEAALYETARVQGGFNQVAYNPLRATTGLSLNSFANHSAENENITMTATGEVVTSTNMSVGQFIKILADVSVDADFTISYSVDGGTGWSVYPKGSVVDLTSPSTQFRVKITCNTGSLTLSSYGVVHSPSQPTGIAGSSVAVEASGFNKNLATTDNTLQKVANKVDQLTTGGGFAVEAVTGLGWSGKVLEKNKEYFLLDTDLASAGSTSTTATLPALSGLAVGEGLIVNCLTTTRGANWSDGDTVRVQRSGADTIRRVAQKPLTALATGENIDVTTGNTTATTYYHYSGDHDEYRRVLFVKATTNTWTAVDMAFLRDNT